LNKIQDEINTASYTVGLFSKTVKRVWNLYDFLY